jgi:hypothetical protein
MTVAPPERRVILEQQRDLLAATTATAMKDERDVKLALEEDREGLGVAAGTTALSQAPSHT